MTETIQKALTDYTLDCLNGGASVPLAKKEKSFEILNSGSSSCLASWVAINDLKAIVTDQTSVADAKNNLIAVYWENVYVIPTS